MGESYQDLMPVINEDNPVQYRYPEKRVSHSRQRPKSLNFEIFINEQEENKTDDEKIENGNGEIFNKGKAQSLNHEVFSQVSQEEDKLNYDSVKTE